MLPALNEVSALFAAHKVPKIGRNAAEIRIYVLAPTALYPAYALPLYQNVIFQSNFSYFYLDIHALLYLTIPYHTIPYWSMPVLLYLIILIPYASLIAH